MASAKERKEAALKKLMSLGQAGAFAEVIQEVENAATEQVLFKEKYKVQAAPVAKTVAATLTIAEILGGLITATHAEGATQAYTLPTGTLSDAAFTAAGAGVNDSVEWGLINLSAAANDTVTLTAGDGHTIVGNPIVTSSHSTTAATSSARFLTRKTAENTFVTYRIA